MASLLGGWVAAGAAAGLAAGPAHPAAVIPAAPVLARVEPHPEGTTLTGSGFGTDPAKVQVLEDGKALPPGAIVSVAEDRIVLRWRPGSAAQFRVVVAGRTSRVLGFAHGVGPAAAAPQPPQAGAGASLLSARPSPREAQLGTRIPIPSRSVTTGEITMAGMGPPPWGPGAETALTAGRAERRSGAAARPLLGARSITTGEITMAGMGPPPGGGLPGMTAGGPIAQQTRGVQAGASVLTPSRTQTVTTGEITMTGMRGGQ